MAAARSLASSGAQATRMGLARARLIDSPARLRNCARIVCRGPLAAAFSAVCISLFAPLDQLSAEVDLNPLPPDFLLNGVGQNVDTIAFWEADSPSESLILVSAKHNSLVEVWPFPFHSSNQAQPIRHASFAGGQVNGVIVGQSLDLLYVSVGEDASTAGVFSLPDGGFQRIMHDNGPLGKEPGIELYQDENRVGELAGLFFSA